jgi:hypothetical protein
MQGALALSRVPKLLANGVGQTRHPEMPEHWLSGPGCCRRLPHLCDGASVFCIVAACL